MGGSCAVLGCSIVKTTFRKQKRGGSAGARRPRGRSHSSRPRTERFRAWGRVEKERRGAARREARVRSDGDWQRIRRGGGCAQHATGPTGSQSETREAVGAVVQHATVPSESEMRDEAMGAVAQRATVPREFESEIEHRLRASASWVITTRASFWVCRCR